MSKPPEQSKKRTHRPASGAVYPITLVAPGRRALVLGGGAVATRKVQGLLDAGIAVTVLSPELSELLRELQVEERIQHRQGLYPAVELDLAEFDLAFAATNSREANAALRKACRKAGILVNIADDPEGSDFHVPAVARATDGVIVAVSTSGRAPARAKALRDQIAKLLADPEGKSSGET